MGHLNLPERIHQRPKIEDKNIGFNVKVSLIGNPMKKYIQSFVDNYKPFLQTYSFTDGLK